MINLPYTTNSSIELSKFAINGLKKIYQKGYKYKEAGVFVMDFINESNKQLSLFEESDLRHWKLMKAIDKINSYYSKDIVRLAAQRHGRTWKMRQEKLSKHYTTNINEILEVH